jgi:hypothetical protein
MIFLPHCGPMRCWHSQSRAAAAVTGALRKVFGNVSIYASLASAQPVRVLVSGFVRHPGMYEGTGNDNAALSGHGWWRRPDRGSFRHTGQAWSHHTLQRRSLSLVEWRSAEYALTDGDVILVGQRKNIVMVGGSAASAKRFEFNGATTLAQTQRCAAGCHLYQWRATRGSGTVQDVEYYPLSKAPDVTLMNGDLVEFTADKKRPGTITVRVEGEHLGPQEYVVPYGNSWRPAWSRGDDIQLLPESTQLFRQSVKDRRRRCSIPRSRSCRTAC